MIPENKIICFKQDTKERKRYFKASSFAHPAKMILGLQIFLIEHYTKQGDTILDPMAGSGTILMACTLGRKEKGLMVLVVKNFIRDKKIIRLDIYSDRNSQKKAHPAEFLADNLS